jgi:CysZ protein
VIIAPIYWDSWISGLTRVVQSPVLERWLAHGLAASLSRYLVVIMLLLLLVMAVYVTALAITGIFAMPLMVSQVASTYFPQLERKRGGTNAGSVANTVVAIAAYCVAWVLTLPLWLIAPLALVLPVLLAAFLNQRLFRYDALAEHASREEYPRVVAHARLNLYILGIIAGLLQFVPLLNLLSPVYIGLAFAHLCLAELEQARAPT